MSGKVVIINHCRYYSLYFGHIAQIISGRDDWKMTLTKPCVPGAVTVHCTLSLKTASQDELQVGELRAAPRQNF